MGGDARSLALASSHWCWSRPSCRSHSMACLRLALAGFLSRLYMGWVASSTVWGVSSSR